MLRRKAWEFDSPHPHQVFDIKRFPGVTPWVSRNVDRYGTENPMHLDTKHLLKRGNSYSLRFVIPKHLRRQHGGRREIVKALGTSCLRTAVMLRDEAIRDLLEQQAIPEKTCEPATATRHGSTQAKRNAATSKRVSQASHEWLLMCDVITPATKHGYRRTLELLEDFTGDAFVEDLDRKTALGFLGHLRETPSDRTGKPRSQRTVASRMVTLSSFWKVCKHLGYVDPERPNPFNGTMSRLPGKKKDPTTTKDLQPVSREDAERFLGAIRERRDRLKYGTEMEAITRLLWAMAACRAHPASVQRSARHARLFSP